MTTLANRPNSALIVIDVQNDVVSNAFERDARIANIAACVDRARANGVPVIWVQHNDEWLLRDTPDWQIVDELTPAEGEPIVDKNFRSSFEQTNLDELLEQAGAGHLYLCGAATNYCVRNTLHAGFERGYDVTLISDAHMTGDPGAETIINEANGVYQYYPLPGRLVTAKASNEIFS